MTNAYNAMKTPQQQIAHSDFRHASCISVVVQIHRLVNNLPNIYVTQTKLQLSLFVT